MACVVDRSDPGVRIAKIFQGFQMLKISRPLVVALLALLATPNSAQARDLVGSRSIAMGGALRASASGTAAVLLNPAAMSLAGMYVIGAAYQYRGSDNASQLSTAIVDTSTARLVHAGVFYNYTSANPSYALPAGTVSQTNTSHEVGLALSMPLGEWLILGVTGRYTSHSSSLDEGSLQGIELASISAFTMDVGGIIRLGKQFSLAVVGYNLIPLDGRFDALYPQSLGLGAAFNQDMLTASFDTVIDFTSHPEDTPKPSFHGGLEYFAVGHYALRAGVMHDTLRDATYVSGGLGLLVQKAGAEFSLRQQVSGGAETLLSMSLNLYLQ